MARTPVTPRIPAKPDSTAARPDSTAAPKPDAAEDFQNMMAKIQGQQNWYKNAPVSKARKHAVAKKMGNR